MQGHTGASHDTTPPRTVTNSRPDRAAANERQRRYQQRLAGLLPPVPRCVDCGCQATAADPDEAEPRCSCCWRRTDGGREWNRARMQTARLISRINRILSEAAA